MRRKLLLAFALPTVLLFTVFGLVALEVTRRDLDGELGSRLTSIASAAATQLRGKYLVSLGPGNENDRSYQNAVKKLQLIEQSAGVRLFVVDRDFGMRADTTGAAIGSIQFAAQLDRLEVAEMFASGNSQASVTFTGNDGVIYKTGYAPVRADDDDPSIVLALGAQAPAQYFARLSELRTSLVYWACALIILILTAVFVATFWITRSVKRLVASADQLKLGDLRHPVTLRPEDDLSVLADTLESMRVALNARDTERNTMLAGIAHEVRNPLAGMMLYADILQEELSDQPAQLAHVRKISKELGYLNRVVSEFLNFSGSSEVNRSDFSLHPLLQEVAELGANSKQAIVVICSHTLSLCADRDQLKRAILNLVSNAAQASDGNEIVVSATKQLTQTVIEVANSGPAIDLDAQPRLFDPFFTTKEKGSGLGLALVRRIVHMHKGDVQYLRRDKHTVFAISLPAQ
jgi:signal transduction histidine kinase